MFRPKSANTRQAPTDLDQPPPEPVLDFDLTRPWPEKYFGQRFGPGFLRKVLRSGRYILCEIEGVPEQWSVSDARWEGTVLEVYTLQGWRIADRLWTVETLKGFKV